MALTSTRTVMSDGGKAAKPKYNDEVLKKIAEELERTHSPQEMRRKNLKAQSPHLRVWRKALYKNTQPKATHTEIKAAAWRHFSAKRQKSLKTQV